VTTRRDRLLEAERRARQRLRHTIDEVRQQRLQAGLTQRQIANALGCSRQFVTAVEAGRHDDTGLLMLSRYAAAVGLDLSVKLYPAGRLLRDAGQVDLLQRFRVLIGEGWIWRTEVPVGRDPRDLRAIDAVLSHGHSRVGIEAITRFLDSQGQLRPILLKQEASGLPCMILLLADTRHNRAAIEVAGNMLRADFPLRAREILRELRAVRQPSANGLLLA
jgi:transcriptional regulator with XRE-family HTH domain